jgi:hypothetical protein
MCYVAYENLIDYVTWNNEFKQNKLYVFKNTVLTEKMPNTVEIKSDSPAPLKR